MKTTLGEFRARTKNLPNDVEVCVVGTNGDPVPCEIPPQHCPRCASEGKPAIPSALCEHTGAVLLFTNYEIHE